MILVISELFFSIFSTSFAYLMGLLIAFEGQEEFLHVSERTSEPGVLKAPVGEQEDHSLVIDRLAVQFSEFENRLEPDEQHQFVQTELVDEVLHCLQTSRHPISSLMSRCLANSSNSSTGSCILISVV